uniref:NADH-ubiquinone oxidoreductase chain 4 n=1 Tax=Minervarya manoharani TaxID=3372176 RepID=A0A343L6P4_9NEOB|nr:NADH dehydrogenase subunit 4 [Fejervarya manoharani]
MLVVLVTWFSLFPTILFSPLKHLWSSSSAQGFIISFFSVLWLFHQDLTSISSFFLIDGLSGPLAVLTCWLFPLTLLASQSKMSQEPEHRQRSYIMNIMYLQLTTLLAFTVSDLMLFFIFFEASLIPTLIIITRWGAQEQRLQAGLYITFYTMISAIPLLLWLSYYYVSYGTLLPFLFPLISSPPNFPYPSTFWLLCNLAFLVKLPLYSLHLWLPMAHVEAPIAGSMVLAGTLLKLGGYGMLRTSILLPPSSFEGLLLLLTLSALGVILTSMLCARQTDLKSLIALSSVSHMNLIVLSVVINTPTSHSGALTMMIAHGITSSAMFCLANSSYERTNSRTMLLVRGSTIMLPLISIWWIMSILFNMAIPPSPNFISELLIFLSMTSWSPITLLFILMNLILTSAYTIYAFWTTQRGHFPNHLSMFYPLETRENILLMLHILPLTLLALKPELLLL